MVKLVSINLILLFIVSCNHNKVDKVKSPLNYLNGENYGVYQGGLNDKIAIPLVKNRTNKLTKISGVLSIKEGIVFAPLNNQKLKLLDKDGQEIKTIMTEAGGQFNFSHRLQNGNYKLHIESQKYQGELNFEIKSYLNENLQVVVTLK